MKILECEESNLIEKSVYGTRVDWEAAVNVDWDNLGSLSGKKYDGLRKRLGYMPEERKRDWSSRNILTFVDKADKEVRGIRLAYDIMCEFLHPNVGDLFSNTRRFERREFADGRVMHFREIGLGGPPGGGHERITHAVAGIFSVVVKVYDAIEMKHKDWRVYESELRKLLRYEVRKRIRQTPDIFYRNEKCFCSSGKTINSCCGRKITGLARG